MSLPELEAAVARLPAADLAAFARWFEEFQADPSPPIIRTGADLVAYWQTEGLVGTRPDIVDGPAYARQRREQAQLFVGQSSGVSVCTGS